MSPKHPLTFSDIEVKGVVNVRMYGDGTINLIATARNFLRRDLKTSERAFLFDVESIAKGLNGHGVRSTQIAAIAIATASRS